jgi:hypothetical protein
MPIKSVVSAQHQRANFASINYVQHVNRPFIAVPIAKNMTGKRNTRHNAKSYKRISRNENNRIARYFEN